METNKHTPGIRSAEEILKDHLNKNGVIITKMYVGYLYEAMEEYRNQDKTPLEKAAPKLLEALKKIHNWRNGIKYGFKFNSCPEKLWGALDEAIVAINQAEGREG